MSTTDSCYRELDQQAKAIAIINAYLQHDRPVGSYDCYHPGVIYFKNREYTKAANAFQKQIGYNNLAEVHYYLSLIYKKLHKDIPAIQALSEAKQLNAKGKKLPMVYTHHSNSIFF